MLHVTRGPPAETCRGVGANGRKAITIVGAIFLTLGLASCVAPYNEDAYSPYGRDHGARRDVGYDQVRNDNYRYDPYAGQREWRGESWWNENSFSRGRNN